MVLKLWGAKFQNLNQVLGPGSQPGSVCTVVVNNEQLFLCQNAIIVLMDPNRNKRTWFEKSIPNGVTMSHDVNSLKLEVKIIELENHPDRERFYEEF